eukprot:1387708-Amphidinium_carterae.1
MQDGILACRCRLSQRFSLILSHAMAASFGVSEFEVGWKLCQDAKSGSSDKSGFGKSPKATKLVEATLH